MKRREVKSCFMVLDDDGSNEVTPFEFKQACRAYGFGGPAKLAFKVPFFGQFQSQKEALDTNNKGALCLDDVTFLDEWAGRRCFRGFGGFPGFWTFLDGLSKHFHALMEASFGGRMKLQKSCALRDLLRSASRT